MLTTVSIVSHGNFSELLKLLNDLESLNCKLYVILTFNIPEDFKIPNFKNLQIKIIHNKIIKGYGENHNFAFKYCSTKTYIVINPDVRFIKIDLVRMINFLDKKIKLVAPSAFNKSNKPLVNGRNFPSFFELFCRFFYNQNYLKDKLINEYPDWVSGMFIVFDSSIYRKINGFDEKFFLYFEDVDICKRIKSLDYLIYQSSDDSVVHEGKRKSKRSAKHFCIHLFSMLRYFILKKFHAANDN